ncbi:MAG: zinc-ribbon domain-containing protein [Thermoclostridium sp.]|nr:zinc-ribbon domain-containing protein [Thermoclostridium sp.]
MVCSNCGKDLNPSAAFCSGCGQAVEQKDSMAENAPQPSASASQNNAPPIPIQPQHFLFSCYKEKGTPKKE